MSSFKPSWEVPSDLSARIEERARALGLPAADYLHWLLERDRPEQQQTDSALRELTQGMSASTGPAFFTAIAQFLARQLQVDFAMIGELIAPNDDRVRAVTMYARGQLLTNLAYDLKHTPCENVVNRGMCAYPFGVQAEFPDDPELREFGIESYIGTPLFDVDGRAIGLMSVMHGAPLTDLEAAKSLLRVVARRVEAELARSLWDQQLQQANELNRLKSAFVNSVTHELRTPLTSIMGYAEFLEDGVGGPLAAEQHAFVAQIQKGARRLEYLLDDLLDFARLEAGTFRLVSREADLADKVAEIVASMRPQAGEQQLKLSLEAPAGPLMGRLDPRRIGQVLANLIGNAIKFSAPGGEIAIRLADGDVLRVEVRDSGVGIAPEELPRLFQRFTQLEAGLRKGTGTGLGLSIAKSIVEAHGGAIGVESTPGEGSLFWFTLPKG